MSGSGTITMSRVAGVSGFCDSGAAARVATTNCIYSQLRSFLCIIHHRLIEELVGGGFSGVYLIRVVSVERPSRFVSCILGVCAWISNSNISRCYAMLSWAFGVSIPRAYV